MVAKKPTKSLKSREKSTKAILTEPLMVTAMSTVGVGDGWGVSYTEKDGLSDLIRLLCAEGVEYDAMARIIRGYLGV